MKINEIITEGFWSSFSRAIGQHDLANQIDAHNKMKDGKAPSAPSATDSSPAPSAPSGEIPPSGDMTTPSGGAETPLGGDFTKVAASSTAASLASNRVAKQKAAVAAINPTTAAKPAAANQTPEQIRIAKQKAAVAAMNPKAAPPTQASAAASPPQPPVTAPKVNPAAAQRLAAQKTASNVNVADVTAAWKSLGYNNAQIDKMLTAIPPGSTTQSAIKFGLKQSLNAGKVNKGDLVTEELDAVFALLKKEVGTTK